MITISFESIANWREFHNFDHSNFWWNLHKRCYTVKDHQRTYGDITYTYETKSDLKGYNEYYISSFVNEENLLILRATRIFTKSRFSGIRRFTAMVTSEEFAEYVATICALIR